MQHYSGCILANFYRLPVCVSINSKLGGYSVVFKQSLNLYGGIQFLARVL